VPIVATARRHLEQAPYRAPTACARRPGRRAVKHRRNPLVRVHEEGGRLAASLRNASAHPLTAQGPAPKQRALMEQLVEIAPLPPVPSLDLLTYGVPEALRDRIGPGMRVLVPLGRQTRLGVVTGWAERP